MFLFKFKLKSYIFFVVKEVVANDFPEEFDIHWKWMCIKILLSKHGYIDITVWPDYHISIFKHSINDPSEK